MSAPLLFLALDVATLVCAALVAGRILFSRARGPAARLMVAIMACNICNVVLARAEYGGWMPAPFRIDVEGWRPVLNLARNLTPGLFMLFSHALFRERRCFPRGLAALFVLQILLEEPIRWVLPSAVAWARQAAAALQILFAGAAVWWAVESWRTDLVETRRRMRAATVLVVGLDVLAVSLLLRLAIPQDSIANYYGHLAFLGANLAILVVVLFRLTGDDIVRYFAPAQAPRPPRPRTPGVIEAQSAAAMARLTALLEVERVYREPGLSLKALADRVGLPEYRLRRLIHDELGHRNFNAFLHTWRIGEACEQLGDPVLRRLPILTIALSVGYQSVNTFNRGFAEIMDTTPSAYRAEADLQRARPRARTASKTA